MADLTITGTGATPPATLSRYLCLTELDAVNQMLEIIGEQPVNSLPANGVPDAMAAEILLFNTNREVQSMKLTSNTETNYPLTADNEGYIAVPPSALSVDCLYRNQDYVTRGLRLYNKADHTYVFTPGQVVRVNITFFLPFTELPQCVRNYIGILAGFRFQERMVGSETLDKFSAVSLQAAWKIMVSTEIDTGKHNLLDSVSLNKLRMGRR